MIKVQKDKKGFSLVEVLVSVAIIALAVTGPIVASEHSFKSSVYAREKVIAGFLATEALEYTRYLIAANNLKNSRSGNSKWLDGLNECIGDNKICGFDPTNDHSKVVSCNSRNSDCLLYFNNSTGLYGHQSGRGFQKSIFRRKIHIDDLTISSGHPNIKVTVSVYWDTEGFKGGEIGSQNVTLTETFFDWRSQPNN